MKTYFNLTESLPNNEAYIIPSFPLLSYVCASYEI